MARSSLAPGSADEQAMLQQQDWTGKAANVQVHTAEMQERAQQGVSPSCNVSADADLATEIAPGHQRSFHLQH
ncbi:TPA: hypothetical protein ACH3X2_002919 [Trebouxia sp. C0005]